MDADFKNKLVEFRTSMALVNSMLLQGIITEQDYEKASEIIAKRVGISLSNICCRMPLRSSAELICDNREEVIRWERPFDRSNFRRR